MLKENMYEVAPDLDDIPKSEATLTYLKGEVLPRAWDMIPQRVFDQVIRSYPQRMQAILAAHGWWTKY